MSDVRTGATGQDARAGSCRRRDGPSASAADGALRRDAPRTTRWWAIVSAALSPLLLTGGWVAADALQPATYSPVRQSVSTLAGYAGTDRWVMTGALFAVGVCHLITAAGAGSAPQTARVVLVLIGLTSIGVAARPEPVHASVPGHIACSVLGAVLLAFWPALLARCRLPRSIALSARGAMSVTVVFLALLGWLAVQSRGGPRMGLAERVVGSTETLWPLVVVLALRRHDTAVRPESRDAGSRVTPHAHWRH